MLPVSASRGRGRVSLSVTLDNLNFLSRFRTTGDKYPRNTCSGAEKKKFRERVCVYVVPHLQYVISEVTVVRYNLKKMTNAHTPCHAVKNGRFVIC